MPLSLSVRLYSLHDGGADFSQRQSNRISTLAFRGIECS